MNNIDKRIPIIIGVLIFILVILSVIVRFLSARPSTQQSQALSPTPTLVVADSGTRTISPRPVYTQDTFIPDEAKKEKDFQIQNHPDSVIAARTPFNDPAFTLTSSFKQQTNEGHFSFIVTLKSTDKGAARLAFLTWLRSLGVTDQQIPILDIQYR